MEHFDAVIVGSGFGGSVMAYRLAEAGKRVCVLERGRAYPPGSFPRGPHGFRWNFWDPSAGMHGLFNVWSFDHLNAVVASGLGGGSLIYANVLIRKDEKWFVQTGFRNGTYEYWPVTRQDLDPHYDAVEKMLEGTPFPMQRAPFNESGKTLAMKHAGEALNAEWFLPKLAVRFGNDPARPQPGETIVEHEDNYHGRGNRSTCRLCGECDVGCNFGSKNTLDYNYLSAAKRHGAQIWTCAEARQIRPRPGGGYSVEFVRHDPERAGQPRDTSQLPLEHVSAERVIVAAGTLGSTYLLLRSREALKLGNSLLGTRFCGNGDFLGFVQMAQNGANGAASGLNPSAAPVITSTLRLADGADGDIGRGMYLQDAGYPEWVNWAVEMLNIPGTLKRAGRFALQRGRAHLTRHPDTDLAAELAELFGEAHASHASMPLLGMGRDTPDGTLSLRPDTSGKNYLALDWKDRGSEEHYKRVRETARRVSEALGGTYLENPLAKYFNRQVTVHPLGGCPMGRDPKEGVVDPWGQVFGLPGLYVADGAVMPGPVGPNPSLTIAALSNRFAERILEQPRGVS